MTGADVRVGDVVACDESPRLTVMDIRSEDFAHACIALRCVGVGGEAFALLAFEDMPIDASGIDSVTRNGQLIYQRPA